MTAQIDTTTSSVPSPAARSSLVGKLARYALATVGPIGTAAAQFFLSIVMLRTLSTSEFGTFSFLIVASVLSWGIWSALFCAPLPLLFHQGAPENRARGEEVILAGNLVGAVLSLIVFFAMGYGLGLPLPAAIMFALYGAIALIRWFARTHAYVHGKQLRTTASDIVYSSTLLIGVLLCALYKDDALYHCYAALLVSAAAGLLPFGFDYLRSQFIEMRPSALLEYGQIWREQSSWSLVGVITTEATANAHVYLVTLLKGPAAFAPIAAGALMMRPIGVAMNALSDFERPQMAKQIGQGRFDDLPRSLTIFRLVLSLVWIGTIALTIALFVFAPRLIFPPRYPLDVIVTGTVMWMIVAAFRLVRTPDSALLQAAGAFRPLAWASIYSSVITVVAVLVLIWLAGTLWSIMGILVGQAIFAFWTIRYANRWLRTARADSPEDARP